MALAAPKDSQMENVQEDSESAFPEDSTTGSCSMVDGTLASDIHQRVQSANRCAHPTNSA
jgi:hypothetical protein